MFKSMGLVEVNSVGMGVQAADDMVKEANVQIVTARPVCPGRYLVMVTGDTGAVRRSVEKGCLTAGAFIVDHFVLNHIHEDVFPAMSGTTRISEIAALGIIETYSAASAVTAADTAVKAANVGLVEIRLSAGLAGKAVVVFTGRIGSVKAAVDAGCHALTASGLLLSRVVIPSPSQDLKQHILA